MKVKQIVTINVAIAADVVLPATERSLREDEDSEGPVPEGKTLCQQPHDFAKRQLLCF